MWYHLSEEKWNTPVLTHLQCPRPEMSYGESDVPRLSVGPTVCHCIAPLSLRTRLFVYQVQVAKPVVPPEKAGIADLVFTREHWVTDDVLAEEGGRIGLTLLGHVAVTDELLENIKGTLLRRRIEFDAEQERELWKIVNDEWCPLFLAPDDIPRLLDLRGELVRLVRRRDLPFLREYPTGTLRVGWPGALLDSVIPGIQHGQTPEAIMKAHATLKLQDVQALVQLVHDYPTEVEEYMSRRRLEVEASCRQMGSRG